MLNPPLSLGLEADALVDISCGECHTCAVWRSGGVKCWVRAKWPRWGGEAAMRGADEAPWVPSRSQGCNTWGQLGMGVDTKRFGDSPKSSGELLPWAHLGTDVRAVGVSARGLHHTCVLLDSGMVKCFGANVHGQLGYGDLLSRGQELVQMGDHLPTVTFGGDGTVKVRCHRGEGLRCVRPCAQPPMSPGSPPPRLRQYVQAANTRAQCSTPGSSNASAATTGVSWDTATSAPAATPPCLLATPCQPWTLGRSRM